MEQQVIGLRQWASAPSLTKTKEAQHPAARWPNYLARPPSMSTLEKELTNNRIKIMNMKTDYHRMK